MSAPLRHCTLAILAALIVACGPLPTKQLAARIQEPPYPPMTVGSDAVSVLPDSEQTFRIIAQAIRGARFSIDLEMYELGRTDLRDLLIDAHQRGIKIRVIDDPTVDVTNVTTGQLRDAGIDVIDYPVRRQMIDHVKLLIVDSTTP